MSYSGGLVLSRRIWYGAAMKTVSNDVRAALSDLATLAVILTFIWLAAF